MTDPTGIEIPAPAAVEDWRVIRCLICREPAPSTLREWETSAPAAQLAVGWQARLILNQVDGDEGPGVARGWGFCPEHAGHSRPRATDGWRLRLLVAEEK